MAKPTIIATISGETSNSYVTVGEADTYMAGRLHASAWESAVTNDKEKALVMACRHIEGCRLAVNRQVIGDLLSPVVPTQALTFPRYRDVDATLAYVIPPIVKQAQCEEALALLAFGAEQQRRSALQAGGVQSFAVDGLSETFGQGANSSPLVSAEARRMMAPFISRGGVIANVCRSTWRVHAREWTVIGSYVAQDVWWKQATGNDGYGQPTFARAVQSKGRWVEKRRLVRTTDGREVLSEISVTLSGDHQVAAGDQLSSDDETYFEVLSVSRAPGLGGVPLTTRAFC